MRARVAREKIAAQSMNTTPSVSSPPDSASAKAPPSLTPRSTSWSTVPTVIARPVMSQAKRRRASRHSVVARDAFEPKGGAAGHRGLCHPVEQRAVLGLEAVLLLPHEASPARGARVRGGYLEAERRADGDRRNERRERRAEAHNVHARAPRARGALGGGWYRVGCGQDCRHAPQEDAAALEESVELCGAAYEAGVRGIDGQERQAAAEDPGPEVREARRACRQHA
eukprot:4011430-Prymnesium_polylepis.1